MAAFGSGDEHPGESVNTPAASPGADSYASSRVSITNVPEGHIIVYKWLPGNKWILVIVLGVMLEASLCINYTGAVGWDNFNLIDYPTFVIVSLFLSYFVAIGVFNKTTTTITATTFSVRRGPVRCPWPGNHTRDINDVRQVYYARQKSVIVNGNILYYVFVALKDGRQTNLFTIINNDGLAIGLATQVQEWINEKQGRRSTAHGKPGVIESRWFPPDRTQRLKITASILVTLLALGAMIAAAEFFAAQYRPVRRARRNAQHYETLSNQLRSPENYAVAVPTRWQTYSRPGRPSVPVIYEGRERALFRRMSETFESRAGGVRLEAKGVDAEYVSGTPCGTADYFVFPLPKSALRKEPSGAAVVETSTLRISNFQPRIVKGGDGIEWLCFGGGAVVR